MGVRVTGAHCLQPGIVVVMVVVLGLIFFVVQDAAVPSTHRSPSTSEGEDSWQCLEVSDLSLVYLKPHALPWCLEVSCCGSHCSSPNIMLSTGSADASLGLVHPDCSLASPQATPDRGIWMSVMEMLRSHRVRSTGAQCRICSSNNVQLSTSCVYEEQQQVFLSSPNNTFFLYAGENFHYIKTSVALSDCYKELIYRGNLYVTREELLQSTKCVADTTSCTVGTWLRMTLEYTSSASNNHTYSLTDAWWIINKTITVPGHRHCRFHGFRIEMRGSSVWRQKCGEGASDPANITQVTTGPGCCAVSHLWYDPPLYYTLLLGCSVTCWLEVVLACNAVRLTVLLVYW